MTKRQAKEEQNPLLGKNIPPPPATTEILQASISEKNGKTVSEENGRRGEQQAMPQAPTSTTTSTQSDEEKATIELSLYLQPTLDDKLEDLRRAYKRRTGRKISANEVMRRLIRQATLEMLLNAS